MAEFARSIDPSRPVTLGVNLMLCSMTAKGGGIYGEKKDKKGKKKENQNGSQTMDNAPTSTFFNMFKIIPPRPHEISYYMRKLFHKLPVFV